MNHTELEQCVGGYGEDTSGQMGRGVFGMGLKDTINAFGEGSITSFKGGKKHQCTLRDVDDLVVDPPETISATDKKVFRNNSGGTLVEIVVTNSKVKIPLIDSLRQQLQTHVCLRGIMTSAARTIVLRDLRGGSADELHYVFPDGETLMQDVRLALSDFPKVDATLTVLRVKGNDALQQTGSYRTGGILITSRRTIHEASLFGFEDDPYAARLFGELRCDEIYDLQVKGDPVVDKNRSGLRKDHDLTKQLLEVARKEIGKLVALEKDKEKHKREALEHEETRRRFREAVKNLNEIAKTELQIGGPAPGPGTRLKPEPHEPRLPENGFEFIPDMYRVLLAERETLKLRVQVDGTTGIAVGDRVEVTCDNPHLHILDDGPLVSPLDCQDPPLALVEIRIEGLQANALGFVTARCGGKTATSAVEVVSTRTQKQHPPSGGLFKDIKYEERRDEPTRARFDRSDGLILPPPNVSHS